MENQDNSYKSTLLALLKAVGCQNLPPDVDDSPGSLARIARQVIDSPHVPWEANEGTKHTASAAVVARPAGKTAQIPDPPAHDPRIADILQRIFLSAANVEQIYDSSPRDVLYDILRDRIDEAVAAISALPPPREDRPVSRVAPLYVVVDCGVTEVISSDERMIGTPVVVIDYEGADDCYPDELGEVPQGDKGWEPARIVRTAVIRAGIDLANIIYPGESE